MDRFREIEAFIAVADEGSFNGAARRLAVSPPIITRLINGLEARIGARMFVRTTRRLTLTEAGDRFLAAARPLIDHLDEAEAAAAGAHQNVRGGLRITAPVLFGERVVLPIVREFLDTWPDVTVTTLFVDRIVHLIDEGVDVAVRLSELPDSSLRAIRVGTVRTVTVAAPAYLERHGMPAAPEDLEEHAIIGAINIEPQRGWAFQKAGKTRFARFAPRLTVNTLAGAIDSAVAGWGIARLLSYQVEDLLRDGRLVEVLADWEDRQTPVSLVHTEGAGASAKTRTFLDFASRRLRARFSGMADWGAD